MELPARLVSFALLALLLFPMPGDAQYFGRNKVQFEQFDFQVLETPHYQIHFYPEAATVIEDGARMAERWYERIARIFEHEIPERRPLILYANHPHFQQTNVLRGTVGEGTGGVTEGLRDRVVMPLGRSYADTDHVLGHELVHSFQFDMARGSRAGGLQGLMQLPLWFVEGMAEYLSLGPESSLTAMWLRDALLRDEFPSLQEMTRDQQRYFPYRFGHAFFAFVAERHGDQAISEMMRVAPRLGVGNTITQILGVSPDTLSDQWRQSVEARYEPLMEGRTAPGEAGTLLLSPETGAGRQNVAPALSPDGRYLAFLSERDLFSTDLFIADVETGEVLRSLTRSIRDAHMDAIRFLDSSGAWSPDGERVAVVVFAEGRNRLQIYRAADGRQVGRIEVPHEIGEIRGPDFSPDGERIVFSGQAGGVSNLYLIEIETGEVTQLTDDRHAALQPTFSPDGRSVAFVTDLGPGTNWDRLTFGPYALGLMDLSTRQIRRVAPLPDSDHWSPQFAPDGESLYFLGDPDGFRDIYRVGLADGQLRRVTRVATAVAGITASTPALSVARDAGTLAFSVFDGGEFHIHSMGADEAEGEPVAVGQVVVREGRVLGDPPPPPAGRVARLLADPEVGLHAEGAFPTEAAYDFSPDLGLDFVGAPTVAVGADRFGTFVGGSIAASFSDLLGDRNVYVAAQAQGELQDVGGQAFYQDMGRRWNWGVGASHMPFRYLRQGRDTDPPQGTTAFIQELQRIFVTQAIGQVAYPFSTIRRLELGGGYTRYGFGLRRDIFYVDALGRLVGEERQDLPAPDALHLGQASLAFVEDNSFFGFTSPVRGWRSRYEVSRTIGSLSFTQVTADHRRYFAPLQQLTFAARGMHLGRYGLGTDDLGAIQPFFLGWEALIRGYAPGSFRMSECTPAANGVCAEYERLIGHRIGVANLEARVPLLGTDRFGLISFQWLPTELVVFADAGLAWNEGDDVSLVWEQRSPDRIPVVSTGVSTRFNILGALIFELYYAYPWQRPDQGAHFGFHLSPGW